IGIDPQALRLSLGPAGECDGSRASPDDLLPSAVGRAAAYVLQQTPDSSSRCGSRFIGGHTGGIGPGWGCAERGADPRKDSGEIGTDARSSAGVTEWTQRAWDFRTGTDVAGKRDCGLLSAADAW